ncbi:MAG: prepilin peptidase [Dehalococcoidia bacterium]
MIVFFWGLLGLAVGSFLNVIIDRVPRDQSIVNIPSHCEVCQHPLAPQELVPVFSYLWLRGRCRHCAAAISRRLPAVELATGVLFAFLWNHYGLSSELPISLLYSCLFLVIFVIDLEQGIIPNKIVYPMLAISLALSPFWPDLGILSALLGGIIGFSLMLIPYLFARGGFGAGDVKLAAVLGTVSGSPLVIVALLMGIVGGGIMASLLLIIRLRKRKETIPFGPFLATSAVITLLWGQPIWDWYLDLF